ncbi:hypothetical protein R6Q59_033711 [Mikania micrantha]
MGNKRIVVHNFIICRNFLQILSKRFSNSANEEMVSDACDLGFNSKLPKKLVECRICHDEDEDSNMETPCACCGSLKHAHRGCVQRWCNEKGNTVCEICLQPFKPGYTSPPPLFHCDGVPMNFRPVAGGGGWSATFELSTLTSWARGNWEISRRDLYNLQFSATGSADHDEPDFDDYITLSSKSLICCRVVAIIFLTLLVLRHTLPIIMNGSGGYTVTMFTLIMVRSIGVLLSIYIMVRAFASVRRREQPQDHDDGYIPSDEENNIPESETQVHVVHVQ